MLCASKDAQVCHLLFRQWAARQHALHSFHDDALGVCTLKDLLSRAGGSTELADEDKVYVIRADGRVASIEQRGGAFRLKDPLLPGDVLLVPPRPLGRDATSVVLDMLLLARAAGEAGALWNLALGSIEDGSISIVDTPASPRSDSTPPAALLEEFQR